MKQEEYIQVDLICKNYQVETVFIEELSEFGLLKIYTIQQQPYLHEDDLAQFEKIIDFNQNLGINIAGVEVILRLLDKLEIAQAEVSALKAQLKTL